MGNGPGISIKEISSILDGGKQAKKMMIPPFNTWDREITFRGRSSPNRERGYMRAKPKKERDKH